MSIPKVLHIFITQYKIHCSSGHSPHSNSKVKKCILIYILFADANGEMPEGLELVTSADCEESWIFTQDGVKGHSGKARRHQRNQQPKGTKPRRWKGSKPSGHPVEEDAESTTSSIAIVPSPERDRNQRLLLRLLQLFWPLRLTHSKWQLFPQLVP